MIDNAPYGGLSRVLRLSQPKRNASMPSALSPPETRLCPLSGAVSVSG